MAAKKTHKKGNCAACGIDAERLAQEMYTGLAKLVGDTYEGCAKILEAYATMPQPSPEAVHAIQRCAILLRYHAAGSPGAKRKERKA